MPFKIGTRGTRASAVPLFSNVFWDVASPDLTSVAMVTASIEAACDFREPIVTDVFQGKALVGCCFFLVFFSLATAMKSENGCVATITSNQEFHNVFVDIHLAKSLCPPAKFDSKSEPRSSGAAAPCLTW